MDGIRSVLKNINKYSCPYKINLHCHTICSDGSLTPIQLFHQAYKIGIQHLAITDHHTIDGYKSILASKEFQELSIEYPTIWSGVEISGLLKGCLVHIIALDFNTTSLDIQKYLQTIYCLFGMKVPSGYNLEIAFNLFDICLSLSMLTLRLRTKKL